MTLLTGIWWASWIMGALSVLMMTALIGKRVWMDRLDRAKAARKVELESVIIEALDDPDRLYEHRFEGKDAEMAGEIVRGFFNVIRGETRAALVIILEELGVAALYLDRLARGTDDDRRRAIDNLSMFDNETVREGLWHALRDPSPPIRMAAAKALAVSKYDFSATALIHRMQVGTVVKTRELRTLFKDLAKRDPRGMAAMLSGDINDLTRILLIHALGRAGDYDVLPAIFPMAEHPLIDVRAETFRTFATMQHPEAIPFILNGLNDPAWEVRAQAALAAGRVGIQESVPLLEAMLEDQAWWVRYRAASALLDLGSAGLVALQQIADESSKAGQIAVLVLAESDAA